MKKTAAKLAYFACNKLDMASNWFLAVGRRLDGYVPGELSDVIYGVRPESTALSEAANAEICRNVLDNLQNERDSAH